MTNVVSAPASEHGIRPGGYPYYGREHIVCGISGVVSKTGSISPQELKALALSMANGLTHRGPDDVGVWLSSDGRVALGQRRLSIIDVSDAGHQPMTARSGRSAITYNGELYNFREMRLELEHLGIQHRTGTDTEVALESLCQWGVGAFARFDSMFSLAWYDDINRSVVLGRDRFGEKPLYYIDNKEYFAFASELNVLTCLPNFDPGIDQATIAAYLSFQYIPSPNTIYKNVRKLEPGHWLRLDSHGNLTKARYYEFATGADQVSNRSLEDQADELESCLISTVNKRLISDVPIGAFLSGGVDSSTIAAIVRKQLGIPLKTFSIGFEGHRDSEHFDAAAIAEILSTDHRDKILSADTIKLGEQIGSLLDEPNGDTSCLPTYLLSKFTREHVTVALSGDGGDELFGGYGRYFNTADEWNRKRAGDESLSWWDAGEVYLSNRILVFEDAELAKLMGEIPKEFEDYLAVRRREISADERPLINSIREFDAANYLPGAVLAKVDRMSMQHSLEVRAPFLGNDVTRFASRLAADACYREGAGKLVLKEVAKRYLPADWMNRPKRGFGLPQDMWGRETLLPVIEPLLLGSECRLAEWIGRDQLKHYVEEMKMNFHPYRAWCLYVLETWLRHHPARRA